MPDTSKKNLDDLVLNLIAGYGKQKDGNRRWIFEKVFDEDTECTICSLYLEETDSRPYIQLEYYIDCDYGPSLFETLKTAIKHCPFPA